jgi:predicted ATP-dependent serine protease
MATRTYYKCTSCGQVYEQLQASCPNCGGTDTFEEQEGLLEPERLSAEQTDDGATERMPEQIRQEVSADMSRRGFLKGPG